MRPRRPCFLLSRLDRRPPGDLWSCRYALSRLAWAGPLILPTLILCAALLPMPLAAWDLPWAKSEPEPIEVPLAKAAQELAAELAPRSLEVLVTPGGIVERRSQHSLPFALVLSAKLAEALHGQGLTIIEQGADASPATLAAEWDLSEARIDLDIKIIEKQDGMLKQIAGANAQLDRAAVDDRQFEPDLRSIGRFAVRGLEDAVEDFKPRTLYLEPIQVAGIEDADRLGRYLADWLRPALGRSQLFHPVEHIRELANLDTPALREHAYRQIVIGARPTAATPPPQLPSLTGDLIEAEATLRGKAYLKEQHQTLQVDLVVRDAEGFDIAANTTDLPANLLPAELLRRPDVPQPSEPATPATVIPSAAGPDRQEPIPPEQTTAAPLPAPEPAKSETKTDSDTENGGLQLQLVSTRGEQQATYLDGDQIQVILRVNQDASLVVLTPAPDGTARTLFVGPIRGGSPLILPDDGLMGPWEVRAPFGEELIWAFASTERPELPTTEVEAFDRLRAHLRDAAKEQGAPYGEGELLLRSEPR